MFKLTSNNRKVPENVVIVHYSLFVNSLLAWAGILLQMGQIVWPTTTTFFTTISTATRTTNYCYNIATSTIIWPIIKISNDFPKYLYALIAEIKCI